MNTVETIIEVEGLTFNQQLNLSRQRRSELEQILSLDPKKANTPLTAQIQELIQFENLILKTIGNRQRI